MEGMNGRKIVFGKVMWEDFCNFALSYKFKRIMPMKRRRRSEN